MKKKIIDLFESLGTYKVVFNPAIKIKPTPHSQPIWIDDMSKVNNSYILTVSTHNDNCKKNLDSLNNEELQSLNIRLYDMTTRKNQSPKTQNKNG